MDNTTQQVAPVLVTGPQTENLKLEVLIEKLYAQTQTSKTLAALEDMSDNLDKASYEGISFEQFFGDGSGVLNIFGELVPGTIGDLGNQKINPLKMRGPLKAIQTNKRRLLKSLEQLTKAEADFEVRSKQMASAIVRKTKHGTKQLREFLQTLAIQNLQPFAAGEPNNTLITGTRTHISLGVKLPVYTLDLTLELDIHTGGTQPEDLKQLVQNKLRETASAVLDHSSSIAMAVSEIIGHDRIERDLHFTLEFNYDGRVYRAIAYSSGKTPVTVTSIVASLETLAVPDKHGVLSGNLDYPFVLAKSKINETVEFLQYINDLPLYRGVAPSLINPTIGALTLSLDEDEIEQAADDAEDREILLATLDDETQALTDTADTAEDTQEVEEAQETPQPMPVKEAPKGELFDFDF